MKTKTKNNILVMLVAILMVFALMPMTAGTGFAADSDAGGKSIVMGTSAIKPGNRIWFGSQTQGDDTVPLDTSWRVLETTEGRAMLISDKLIARIQYNDSNNDTSQNAWANSKARQWCMDYYDNWEGSGSEKDAILETSKYDASYQTGTEEIFSEMDIEHEHFFLLSSEEADKLFESAGDRIAYYADNGQTDYWWLRSWRPDRPDLAAFVWANGWLNNYTVTNYYGARPAFNLDLSAVVMTSVPGSKTGDIGGFVEIRESTSNERKLTLYDVNLDKGETLSVSVDENADLIAYAGYSGWKIPVDFAGGRTGQNEYVSAVLCNSDGEALYYGSFSSGAASGQIDFAIPDGLGEGTYTLNIFNEQKNSDGLSDYAGTVIPVELKVEPFAPVIDPSSLTVKMPEGQDYICLGDAAEVSVKVTDDSKVTSVMIVYKGPDNWYRWPYLDKSEGDIWSTNFDVLDTTLPAVWKIRYIEAKDDEGNVSKLFNSDIVAYETPNADLTAGNLNILKWCNVSFDSRGGSDVEAQKVLMGKRAAKPDAPEKDGFGFAGWYADEDLTKPFSFNATINDDIKLYARWAGDDDESFLGNYTVTFDDKYHVLDDDADTPYEEWFYDVPKGTVLEPIVRKGENTLSSDCYKASYSECAFDTERHEWNIKDENDWINHFPTEEGVYFCKVEGVDPYYGSYEWIDLIRITQQKPEPQPTPTSSPAPAPAPGSDPNQMGKDGTPTGEGASAAAAENAITSMTSDKDLAGSVFGKLSLRSPKQTKNSIKLKWKKVSGAEKYVVYTNKCGNGNKPQKLATVTGTTKNVRKVAGKKLKKGTYYKFIVVALDKNNNVVSTSRIIHVATKGGKVGNHKSVTVSKKVISKAKKLKKGKSLKLNAKAAAQSKKLKVKKHVAVRYESSNSKIATVSAKGVIKGKSKGKCIVYAYAQNGVFAKIKVTVR